MLVKRKWCRTCGAYRRFEKEKANHILHLLLTIVTGGLWLIVWIMASCFGGSNWSCSVCGGRG